MTKNLNLDHLPRLPDVNTSRMVQGTCEFCKKRYWIDVEEMRVLHEVPYCAEFEVLDPLDFISKNNRIKEGKVAKA